MTDVSPDVGANDEVDGRRPPNDADHDRGSRQDAPEADSLMPGRAFGAGGQTDDGPNAAGGEQTGAASAGSRSADDEDLE